MGKPEGLDYSFVIYKQGLSRPTEVALFKIIMFTGVSILALAQVAAAAEKPRPMFARRVGLHPNIHVPTGSGIPTSWDFSWTYGGTKYTAVFLGTDPSKGSKSTTIPVEIIPVITKYSGVTENPLTTKVNGTNVVALTDTSPIFESKTTYKQGTTNLGTTQYEDAFVRGQAWGYAVSKNTGYHVLLGMPKVESTLTINATSKETNPFGSSEVLLLDINTFDNDIQSRVAALPANSLPLFITVNTFLTSGGSCCIGGYHNYNGTQAYSMFTYITDVGSFAQDVSALSHELGEWLDDPLTNNSVACGIYEVGDPLEGGQPGHPYGTWAYSLHGFTYHLQDLVLPAYFGAPTTTSMPKPYDFTFQGYTGLGVCSNGG